MLFCLLAPAIFWLGIEFVLLACWFLGLSFHGERPPWLVRPHPYRLFQYIPGSTSLGRTCYHNSFGLRDRELPAPKPPGTIRLVCLGGSTTYGPWATTNTHTYPAHLERLLRERYAKSSFAVEVINAGQPLYSSLETLILFQTLLLDFSPDVVILQLSINDAFVGSKFRGFAGDFSRARHTMSPPRPALWEYSPLLTVAFAKVTGPFNPYQPNLSVTLMNLTHNRWEDGLSPAAPAQEERARESADTLERNVLSFIAVARGNGIVPVLATDTYARGGDFFDVVGTACNDRLRAVATSYTVVLVDFARDMPWDSQLFYDTCHLRDAPGTFDRKAGIFADASIRAGVIEQVAHRAQE